MYTAPHDRSPAVMLPRLALMLVVCLASAAAAADKGIPSAAEIENILAHQRSNGGWPKNYDRTQKLGADERRRLAAARGTVDTMIDNGATHTEIRALAKAATAEANPRAAPAALAGIDYLLAGQYPNGGWPQRFPGAQGYDAQITFNDNAMSGVLDLLQDIAAGKPEFSFVPPATRARCREAVRRGTDCILACQVVADGKPTVWCAQHDRETLRPCKARSYELPSLSGGESVGVVRFLMRLDRPSPRVVAAIDGAGAWFERARVEGMAVAKVPAPGTPRGYDIALVPAPGSRDLWARFYDLETHEPFVCGRDGKPKAKLADIPYERRVGYSWYGPYAKRLLDEELPRWRKQVGR